MASTKTVELSNAILNATLRGIPYVPPSAVYLALLTSLPDATTGGTEVPVGPSGYVRMPVVFGPPSAGGCVNVNTVQYPIALSSWGTIVALELWDAPSGGNRLRFTPPLTVPLTVDPGFVVQFSPGNIEVRES